MDGHAPSVEQLIKKIAEAQASIKSFEADTRMVIETRDLDPSIWAGHLVHAVLETDGKAVMKLFHSMTTNKMGVGGEAWVEENKTVEDGTYDWREERRSDRAEVLVTKTDTIHKNRAVTGQSMWKTIAGTWDPRSVKMLGDDAYDGRIMFVLESTIRRTSGMISRTWIGQDDCIVYRWAQRSAYGSLTVEMLNVKVNQPVDPKLFEYTPPEGAEIDDQTKAKP